MVTADEGLAARVRTFISHGMVREPDQLKAPSPGPWYYEQQELGYNYRITDIQCALGTSQMSRLEGFVDRRRHLARLYEERLASLDAVELNDPGPDGSVSAYHLFGILLDFEGLGTTRAEVMQGLRERCIGTQVHYIPYRLSPTTGPATTPRPHRRRRVLPPDPPSPCSPPWKTGTWTGCATRSRRSSPSRRPPDRAPPGAGGSGLQEHLGRPSSRPSKMRYPWAASQGIRWETMATRCAPPAPARAPAGCAREIGRRGR